MSESVQGSIVTDTDRVALHAALDEAFGYRGDVTVVTNDGRRIVGYIFDIRSGKALAESFVRVLTASSDERVVVRYDEIQSLEFTGRDTAAGLLVEILRQERAGRIGSSDMRRRSWPASLLASTPIMVSDGE